MVVPEECQDTRRRRRESIRARRAGWDRRGRFKSYFLLLVSVGEEASAMFELYQVLHCLKQANRRKIQEDDDEVF